MTMNEQLLTPRQRKIAYALFDAVGTILAAAEAGVLVTGHHWTPLTVSLAVYGALSARVHGLARKNTPTD